MNSKPTSLTVKEIKNLAERHLNEPFNVRDAALITCSGMMYLTLLDLSLLRVKDLVNEAGKIYKQTVVPKEFNPNGKQKVINIPNSSFALEILQGTIDWRKKHKLGLSNIGSYQGLNPDSRFFLDDEGHEFGLTTRTKGSREIAKMQPTKLRRHFKSFAFPEGVTYQGLNKAFIENFYNESIKDGKPSITIKCLVGVTCLGVDTIRRYVYREPRSVEQVLSSLY